MLSWDVLHGDSLVRAKIENRDVWELSDISTEFNILAANHVLFWIYFAN